MAVGKVDAVNGGLRLLSCGVLLVAAGCVRAGRSPAALPAIAHVGASAVSVPLPAAPLTVSNAVARAVALGPEIRSLSVAVEAAFRRVRAAGDLRDPELRFSYGEGNVDHERFGREVETMGAGSVGSPPVTGLGTTSSTGVDDGTGRTVGLRFFPPNPWVRRAAVSAARASLLAAQADLLHGKRTAASEARRLFAEVVYLEQDKALVRDLAAEGKGALDLVRRRMAQGQSTVEDTMAASRRYLAALNDQDDVLRALDEARGLLSQLIDAPTDRFEVDARSVASVGERIPALDPGDLARRAAQRRADASAAHWRACAAQSVYRKACAANRPWLTYVQGVYGVEDETSDRVGSAQDEDTGFGSARVRSLSVHDESDGRRWEVDMAVNVPLFAWFNGEAAAREAERDEAVALETETVKRVEWEVRGAVENLRSVAERRRRYAEEATPLLSEMERTLAELPSRATLPPLDVARIKVQILECQRLRLRAGHQTRLAVIRLDAAVGDVPGAD